MVMIGQIRTRLKVMILMMNMMRLAKILSPSENLCIYQLLQKSEYTFINIQILQCDNTKILLELMRVRIT